MTNETVGWTGQGPFNRSLFIELGVLELPIAVSQILNQQVRNQEGPPEIWDFAIP